ncbi:helix-turn-helix domain-containing protein [Salinivibrio socompensis]|uniref:helix-turn-helix domain-containing protein n=1 Tax=Salinivibrio socompensis TaxID=1510206 RepID=UPI0004727A13|nr:helix-turn-helix transcriptional regulator [Salinivibrio socompensis]
MQKWLDALRIAKARSGLSYRQIATKTGMSRSKVGRVFSGEKEVTLKEFGAICYAIGVRPETIVISTMSDSELIRYLNEEK